LESIKDNTFAVIHLVRLVIWRIGIWKTHFLTVPFLSAPAKAVFIDDASASTAASWVFSHTYLRLSLINN
jgi:hypothetical protein